MIIFLAIILGTLGLIAYFFVSSEGISANAKVEAPSEIISFDSSKREFTPTVSESSASTSAAPPSSHSLAEESEIAQVQEINHDLKLGIITRIHEAITLYSVEGVDQIAPLLLSPDPEIREEAIEGMKQLHIPEAATALRAAAARGTTSPEDRAAMLEAADFVELPEYRNNK